MKSIEKLRKALKDCTSVSGVEPNQFDTYWITAAACDKYIDEIEREIAEKYMELPVDMNEEPIHPGDLMTSTAFDRNAIDGKEHVFAVNYDFWVDKDNCTHIPAETRHVKPRTIEDVLLDYGNEIARQGHQAGLAMGKIAAEYADELRSMGVGE